MAHNEGTGTEDVAEDDGQGQLDRLDLGSGHHHRGGPGGADSQTGHMSRVVSPGVPDTQFGSLKGAVLYD